METIPLLHALEKGFLTTPYVIAHLYPTCYVQFPIHRQNLSREFPESLFIKEYEEARFGYKKACLRIFAECWKTCLKDGKHRDFYLVFNPDCAYYLSKDCPKANSGSPVYCDVPTGGVLYSVKNEILRINQSHYIL